jgi:hypothetical protein
LRLRSRLIAISSDCDLVEPHRWCPPSSVRGTGSTLTYASCTASARSYTGSCARRWWRGACCSSSTASTRAGTPASASSSTSLRCSRRRGSSLWSPRARTVCPRWVVCRRLLECSALHASAHHGACPPFPQELFIKAHFRRLQLKPLSDEQQHVVIRSRVEPVRDCDAPQMAPSDAPLRCH